MDTGPALSTSLPPPTAQAPFRSPSDSLSHSSGVFSKPVILNLKSICQCLETTLVLLTSTSSGWRPGILPSILQCIGQPPPQRIIQPYVLVMQRLRNLLYKDIPSKAICSLKCHCPLPTPYTLSLHFLLYCCSPVHLSLSKRDTLHLSCLLFAILMYICSPRIGICVLSAHCFVNST